MSEIFLVRLHRDPIVQRLVRRPVELWWSDGDVDVIPKDVILCDACSRQVAADEKEVEEGLPIGYAVVDDEWLVEVVCEDCRLKYFRGYRVFDEISDGLGGG